MEYKSKTQRKNEANSAQKLGERLVHLRDDQLRNIALPQDIYEAVMHAKTIRARGGLRRQMQLIGALMRRHDTSLIQEAIEDIDRGHDRRAAQFREIEKWRDALMAGNDNVMEEIAGRYPDMDRQHVAQLVRNAIRERETGKTPVSFRALFRYLRDIGGDEQHSSASRPVEGEISEDADA